MLELVAFAVGGACVLALFAIMVVTFVSDVRLWPPGDDDRKFKLYVTFSRTFLLAFLATTALDWGGTWLPVSGVARDAPGALLLVAGVALLLKSGKDLGGDATKGQADELQTDGLYRYSRNPQNLAYLVFFASLAVLSNSTLVAALAAGATAFMLLQAVVEEPWLRETYGEAYLAYRERVPRFVGLQSVTRAVATLRD
ncbi:methyltransferase family protein [Halorubellus salinus]|uniref:methyltransferase family protein n=1 Tax=Halorubellus salinus TaxID=755309 RepID=UPI001D077FF7|nr:isoprenylcysteine carboxylmethyltransferase family protein [Halorubellus salinus]